MLKGKVKKIIAEMQLRAKNLREDWLVSMSEGAYNKIMAEELEQWAKKLESAMKTGLVKTEQPKLFDHELYGAPKENQDD